MGIEQILTQSIKDHKAAIDKAEKELANLRVTYSIGDRFVVSGLFGGKTAKYILARHSNKSLLLTSLDDGNRWYDSVKVGDVTKVTQTELDKIFDLYGRNCTLTRYWDNQKKVNTK